VEKNKVITRAYSEFELNKCLNYQIKKLTFFRANSGDKGIGYKVDRLTMKTIFHELSKTSIKNSLEIIKFDPLWFSPSEFKAILHENGFNVEVVTKFDQRPKK
jgi:hypothetical protein